MAQKEQNEFNKDSIDDETDFVLDKFAEGYRLVEIKGIVKNYIEARYQQTFIAIGSNDYKVSYYIYKKLEKVLIKALKNFNQEPDLLTEYSKVMLYLLDINQTVSSNEKLMILKLPTEVQVYPKVEDIDFYYYLLKYTIQTLNNIGVILMRRKKIREAETYLMRALAARSYVLETNVSQFQMGVLLENLGFVQLNKGDKQDAKQFITKALLIFEQLSSPQYETVEVCINYKFMLNLVEILFNQNEEQLLSPPREIQKERMIHLLAITYNYYGEVFQSLSMQDQQKFCQEQFQFLCNLMQKLNPRIEARKKRVENPQPQIKPEVDKQAFEIAKHKINQVQVKVEKADLKQNQLGNENFQKEKDQLPSHVRLDQVLYQTYILIRAQRFKVIILQFDFFIQIIIFSKPLNLEKSLYIVEYDLTEYQKKNYPDSQNSVDQLCEFFKKLIKLLYFSDNQLHIKDIRHFQSIEEFNKLI
ncbi:unnamed protein product [Paramecium octaurelia]|uniref:Tetratricopeptide repeat protein n=1 Tax=Paramecium octaurelia TaxID=43137 RepID=A0A8S1SFT6_PAROT|nr:unnamed protein product [Paramecium octaurelia]